MTKFKFERLTPENILKRTIYIGALKTKTLIEGQGLKLTSDIQEKIDLIVAKLAEKNNVNITSDNVLKLGLEMINKEQGVFPKKLEQAYIKLIANEIANAVASKQDLYKILGKKVVELKKSGISVDSILLEKTVKDII